MAVVIPFPCPVTEENGMTWWPAKLRPPGSGLVNFAGGMSAQIRGEWVWFREDHQAEIIPLRRDDDDDGE